jgi:hypothetical protein
MSTIIATKSKIKAIVEEHEVAIGTHGSRVAEEEESKINKLYAGICVAAKDCSEIHKLAFSIHLILLARSIGFIYARGQNIITFKTRV